ncbi:hypothetical protein PINS_up019533 [Pythium insidiosum]|nr:hypothetical protein PINS_up019533 [Pythium insidiosum]
MAPSHEDDDDDLALRTRFEQLVEALVCWMPSEVRDRLSPVDLAASVASCAAFEFRLDTDGDDDGDSASATTEIAAAFAELLRMMDLVGRSGYCLAMAVFRSLLRGGGLHTGCPLSDWCAFCSGEDRSISLKLTWHGSPKTLETALFDWEERDAQPGYREVQEVVEDMENACIGAHPTPRQRQLIQLSLELSGSRWADDHTSKQQELRELLKRYKYVESCGELELFRIKALDVYALDEASQETVIESGLPITIGKSRREWEWVVKALPTRSAADAWSPESTFLARANVTRLRARVSGTTACDNLHEVLYTQPTRLKELRIVYDVNPFPCGPREDLCAMIAATLFSQQSALRLNRLVIKGHLTRSDLLTITNQLKSETTFKPLRELVLEDWDLRVFEDQDEDEIQPGALIAALVRRIGGVESLRIERYSYKPTDLALAQVLPLTICRDVDVSVDPLTWRTLLSPSTVGHPALPADARLERLVLRLSGVEEAEIEAPKAIRRLLEHVGAGLRSLSIIPHSWGFLIGEDTAKAIAELCPNLEALHVQYVDDWFGAAFADALVMSGCSQLERLSLRCRTSRVTMFSLVSTLRNTSHPLSRSLRLLRLDMHNIELDDDGSNSNSSSDSIADSDEDVLDEFDRHVVWMLQGNKRLLSVTIRGNGTEKKEELTNYAGSAVLLLPLRHLCAVLSALARYKIPQEVLVHTLKMVGYRMARLQFGKADDADTGTISEGYGNW